MKKQLQSVWTATICFALCAVVQIEQSKLSQSIHFATASSFALQLVQIKPLKLESDADLFRNTGSNCKELSPRSPTVVSCLQMGQVIVFLVFFLPGKTPFSLKSSLSNSISSFTQISHRTCKQDKALGLFCFLKQ